MIYILQKIKFSFEMFFSLIWLILPGKGDDMCRNIVKEEYFTFVRLENENS